MIVEFSQEEVQLLVEALRIMEKNSRRGFMKSILRRIRNDPVEAIKAKARRASEVWDKIVSLRARLGDTGRVRID